MTVRACERANVACSHLLRPSNVALGAVRALERQRLVVRLPVRLGESDGVIQSEPERYEQAAEGASDTPRPGRGLEADHGGADDDAVEELGVLGRRVERDEAAHGVRDEGKCVRGRDLGLDVDDYVIGVELEVGHVAHVGGSGGGVDGIAVRESLRAVIKRVHVEAGIVQVSVELPVPGATHICEPHVNKGPQTCVNKGGA